jgi:hypothetical protein
VLPSAVTHGWMAKPMAGPMRSSDSFATLRWCVPVCVIAATFNACKASNGRQHAQGVWVSESAVQAAVCMRCQQTAFELGYACNVMSKQLWTLRQVRFCRVHGGDLMS